MNNQSKDSEVNSNVQRFEKEVRDILDEIGFVNVPFTHSYNGKEQPIYEHFEATYAGWDITGYVDNHFNVQPNSLRARKDGYRELSGNDVCPEQIVNSKELNMDLELAKDKASIISRFYSEQRDLMDKYGKVVNLSILEK